MTSPSPSSPRWSLETKRWAMLMIFLVVAGLVYYARSALSWLVVAALLAYLLQPLVNWLDDHDMPRSMAAIVALLVAIGVLFIIPAILLPLLLSQFAELVRVLMDAGLQGLEQFNQWLEGSQMIHVWGFRIDLSGVIKELARWFDLAEGSSGIYVPNTEDLLQYFQQWFSTAAGLLGTLSGFLTSLLARTVSLAFSLFLMIFYTFYITVDGYKLKPWVQSLVPAEYLPEISELGHRINRVWHAFFRGQLMLSLVIGTMTLVAGLIIGLPSALALAIIAGIMEAVPTIGPIIAAVPAVVLALAQGSSVLPVGHVTFALITLAVYVLIQQLENALIVPRIMGSALELHPMVVLVGVVIGASFAGVLGIFLAAPTLATLKVLFMYTHAKLLDRDPFPVSYEEERALWRRQQGPGWRERWRFWRQRASLLSQWEDESLSGDEGGMG